MASAHNFSPGSGPPYPAAAAASAYLRLWLGAPSAELREHVALISSTAGLDRELQAMPPKASQACLARLATAIVAMWIAGPEQEYTRQF